MAHDVFISYARSTCQAAARRLRDRLFAHGVNAFLDEREIAYGAAFPAELARGLLDARVIVVFADETYFDRPWCVHEFRVLTAAFRASAAHDDTALDGIVVALPASGDIAAVTAQLPPPLAAASWPTIGQPEALCATVLATLESVPQCWRERLSDVNDDTIRRLLTGANQPLPWATTQAMPHESVDVVQRLDGMPASRGELYLGRAGSLWQLVGELVTARAFTPARRVVLQGLGGSGKSQLAAEFVARHGWRFFPAGVVWTSADDNAETRLACWHAVWKTLAPALPLPSDHQAPVVEQLRTLGAALERRAREVTRAGQLLWVIDGVPEPGREGATSLATWCPLLGHATVLATTRRTGLMADATIDLGALSANAGRELLTRPPVDAAWLSDAEWNAVVRWVGALPLVLSLLRAGLLDGCLTAQSLRTAPAAEPAAEADHLMDLLCGEVDDASLRGVAEAFEMSWRAISADPTVANAAMALAHGAPQPWGETLLAAAIGANALGKLARRGWLQSVAGDGERAWSLHRVPASVLRGRTTAPAATLAWFFDALAGAVADPTVPAARLARLDTHVDHLGRRYLALRPEPSAISDAAGVRLALATIGGSWVPELRGLRYLVARLADELGGGEIVTAALEQRINLDGEELVAALPHTLQALRHSPLAVAMMVKLLSNPRHLVRGQAIVHATALPLEAIGLPLLEAILAEENTDYSANIDPVFQDLALLRPCLSHLLRHADDPAPGARQHVARLLRRALLLHGPEFTAGEFHAPGLITRLLVMALDDTDANVRETAAAAAGSWFNDQAWAQLMSELDAPDHARKMRVLQTMSDYLTATRKPRLPHAPIVDRDDEGGLTLQLHLGESPPPLPGMLFSPLLALAEDTDVELATAAAQALLATREGMAATAPHAHLLLDSSEATSLARLARLGEAMVRARPDFVNAHWWRAQAREALGDADGALNDYETVQRLAPEFNDAREFSGRLHSRLGFELAQATNFTAAAPHLLRACEALPDDFTSHHLAALALYNLQRYVEAASAASRAIELKPEVGEAWHLRACARSAAGRHQDAMADIEVALQRSPKDERIIAFHAELSAWMQRQEN